MSIYIPDRHAENDPALIRAFLDSYSFAMVVTVTRGLEITNVPVLLDDPAGGETWGALSWHLARSNPQNETLAGGEATLVFHSPHAYISPNWYASSPAVPTWNFASVHCTGRAVRIDDESRLEGMLARLTAINEQRYGGGERWKLEWMPEAYLAGMRRGVIGWEMKIERVEAKFKLGQERPAGDRAGVLEALRENRSAEKSLAQLTEEYYLQRPR